MAEASRAEINRLYWDTDRSVGEIADHLGVSRRSLYDSIDPRPAGATCPECGGSLGFRNRTAADSGEAECPACGMTTELGQGFAALDPEESRAAGEAAGRRLPDTRPRNVPRNGPLLGSTLLAGLALGAAAGYLIRRR